jgi:hypothetical protein
MNNKCGVLFVKKGGFGGTLVSLAQFDFRFDHVAIFTPHFVYEMCLPMKDKPDIVYDNINNYIQSNNIYCAFHIPEFKEEDIIYFMDQNKSKEYDWKKSLGWVLRHFWNIDDSSKWNCVEMVYYTFLHFKKRMWNENNISPKKLYKIMRGKYRKCQL